MRQVAIFLSLPLMLFICTSSPGKPRTSAPGATPDNERSMEAFREVATVLLSPRCLNCHVRGDGPRQGDDHHIHMPRVMRGPEGKGMAGLRCSNCHQDNNHDSPGGPPGVPGWQMPPANTPMAWEGLSSGELCRTITNPEQNGHRTHAQVMDHLHTQQVTWAWTPGPGRTVPPLTYDQFLGKVKEWIDTGSVCEK